MIEEKITIEKLAQENECVHDQLVTFKKAAASLAQENECVHDQLVTFKKAAASLTRQLAVALLTNDASRSIKSLENS